MVVPTDWKEVRLGDICELSLAASKKSRSDGRGKYIIADMGSVSKDGSFLTHKTTDVREDVLRTGDLVMPKDDIGGGQIIGKAVLVDEDERYVLGDHVYRLRLSDGCPAFVRYGINSYKVNIQLRSKVVGSAQLGLGRRAVLEQPISFPLLKEQEAIAEVLSAADAAVESIDALIAKKRDVKQATMQQLLTSRTRLPGFTTDWKEVRLGECLIIMHGKNQSQIIDPEGRYPILATGGVIGRTNSYLSNKPSVLIGRKGTIDRPQFMDTPFWTVDTLFYSEVKNGNSAKFLFYKFLMVDWKKYNEASGVPSLNASTIENVEMLMPPLKEQEAIAEVLSAMDDELEALTEQVSKLQMVKDGMMQDLLTGKVRLV